jgi:hypothetical protein
LHPAIQSFLATANKTAIRAHVLISFLALLLCRVGETRAKDTSRNLRRELDASTSATSTVAPAACSSGPSSPRVSEILTGLDVPEPPRFLAIEPTTDA